MCMCVCVYMCIHMCMYVCACVCVHIYVCTCICMCLKVIINLNDNGGHIVHIQGFAESLQQLVVAAIELQPHFTIPF